MARRRKGIPGLSFSWKRALGVTSAKRKVAKFTGIPTTRSGRQRKAARLMGCGGCLLPVVGVIAAVVLVVAVMG